MSSALCIDFGTSSIRAVYRDSKNDRHVLPIGLVTGAQSIDEASIRSEIHIDADGKNLKYGEHAFIARAKLAPTKYYESSPKLWLLQPDNLDKPAFPGLSVTRRELLTGLLAYGISGAKVALVKYKIATALEGSDIRIAHPVWSDGIAKKANRELLRIGFAASKMADAGELGEIPLSTLTSYFDPPHFTGSLQPTSDVVEPIAAALELLTRTVNVRKICAVVDVGAGTTDIGLFYSVVTTNRADRLIPLSSTRSVFKAGNEIDKVLYRLLSETSGSKNELRLYDVQTRIRQIKEFLFTNGFVQELGVRITLDDIESDPEIRKMALEIRSCLEQSVQTNAKQILSFYREPQIEIVMAGGGGTVNFIRNILSKKVYANDQPIPVYISSPEGIRQLTYGASHERLAVALGGANIHYDSLKHEHENLTKIPSLGQAKQDVTKSPLTFKDRSTQPNQPAQPSVITPHFKEQLLQLEQTKQEQVIWRGKISKLELLAKAGSVDAQYEIADQLITRSSQYVKAAMEWLVRAARQGHLLSQQKLVQLLLSGEVIEINYTDAYFWLLVAARNGSNTAQEESKKIRSLISRTDADKIQIEVISWQPKSESIVRTSLPKDNYKHLPISKLEPQATSQLQPNTVQTKKSLQVIVNPFEELKIRELVRYSSFLKKPAINLNGTNELLKWSKKKDLFESAFLAKYCGLPFDTTQHLSEELQLKLASWLSFIRHSEERSPKDAVVKQREKEQTKHEQENKVQRDYLRGTTANKNSPVAPTKNKPTLPKTAGLRATPKSAPSFYCCLSCSYKWNSNSSARCAWCSALGPYEPHYGKLG
jgi:hypothetical protein